MMGTALCVITSCNLREPGVSEKHIASICRVEKKANKELSKRGSKLAYFSGLKIEVM
jgi:hypothetical protein